MTKRHSTCVEDEPVPDNAGVEQRTSRRTVYRAVVFDKRTGHKCSKTFDTITAARQWRDDARVALRAGTITTSPAHAQRRGHRWLDALRAGHVRNRFGDPYKPSAIRGYDHTLQRWVLPRLGHLRLGEIRPQDVQKLVDDLVRTTLAPATVDSALTPHGPLPARCRPRRGRAQPDPADREARRPQQGQADRHPGRSRCAARCARSPRSTSMGDGAVRGPAPRRTSGASLGRRRPRHGPHPCPQRMGRGRGRDRPKARQGRRTTHTRPRCAITCSSTARAAWETAACSTATGR